MAPPPMTTTWPGVMATAVATAATSPIRPVAVDRRGVARRPRPSPVNAMVTMTNRTRLIEARVDGCR